VTPVKLYVVKVEIVRDAKRSKKRKPRTGIGAFLFLAFLFLA